MNYELYQANNEAFMLKKHKEGHRWDMVFADPPDNIQLGYDECADDLQEDEYAIKCAEWICTSLNVAPILWWSFNARHTPMMGHILYELNRLFPIEVKPCVQTFTFGQHNKRDFGNNHRPLWRISVKGKNVVYPEQIRVPSWRQLNGDKRANPEGRVPGDVFDFPRVTGNSKQRRPWHPTQLHEDLVKRCILSSTREGASVLDIFGGTGTTLRVCKQINRSCTLVEMSPNYCNRIAAEHSIPVRMI